MSPRDEWNFKVGPQVERIEPNEEIDERKERKSRFRKKLRKNREKAPKEMKLVKTKWKGHVSRTAVADKVCGGEPSINSRRIQKPANPFMRGVGFGVDVAFMTGTYFASYIVGGVLEEVPKAMAFYDSYSQLHAHLSAHQFLSYAILALSFLLFYLLPVCFFHKSLGKKLMGIEIVSTKRPYLTTPNLVFRELIAKPLSIALLLGLVMPFFNRRRMSLHDYLCSTAVVKG